MGRRLKDQINTAGMQFNEQAGALDQPASGYWNDWYESDGKHFQDDAGNEDIFASLNATQTLTNKTIDADDNAITNIGASEVEAGIITDQTAETSVASDDLVLLSDTSASGALRKMTVANLTALVGGGAVDSVFGRTGTVVATTSDYDADQIDYDNGVSGLTATDVQAAIDELEGLIGGGGASTALDNLASVAINTSLVSDTDNTDDLGSSTKLWANVYAQSLHLDKESGGTQNLNLHWVSDDTTGNFLWKRGSTTVHSIGVEQDITPSASPRDFTIGIASDATFYLKYRAGANILESSGTGIKVVGGLTVNDDGNDVDTRIEGDTNANLFMVDASADAIGIGTATPSNKTILDVVSTTRASRGRPTMTTTQRDAITSPATASEIYNSTTSQFEYYTGSAWVGFATETDIDALPDKLVVVVPPKTLNTNYNSYAVTALNTAASVTQFSFSTFSGYSVSSANIHLIVGSATDVESYDLASHYNAIGSGATANTESLNNQPLSLSNGTNRTISVTGVMTGVTAGDDVGISLTNDKINSGNMSVKHLEVVFTKV